MWHAGTALVRAFADSAGNRTICFETRRQLLQILDDFANVKGMVMLNIRPALLKYGTLGHTPVYPEAVFPEQKTELTMCIDLPDRMRYVCVSSAARMHVRVCARAFLKLFVRSFLRSFIRSA